MNANRLQSQPEPTKKHKNISLKHSAYILFSSLFMLSYACVNAPTTIVPIFASETPSPELLYYIQITDTLTPPPLVAASAIPSLTSAPTLEPSATSTLEPTATATQADFEPPAKPAAARIQRGPCQSNQTMLMKFSWPPAEDNSGIYSYQWAIWRSGTKTNDYKVFKQGESFEPRGEEIVPCDANYGVSVAAVDTSGNKSEYSTFTYSVSKTPKPATKKKTPTAGSSGGC